MGWLWSSTPTPPVPADQTETHNAPEPAPSVRDPSQPRFGLSDNQRSRIFGQPSNASSPLPSDTRAREEQADAELTAFLNSFTATDTPTTDSSQQEQQPSEPAKPTQHDRILPDGSLSIHPTALYPRTMSCREAFDQAFYCQSIGGKFNDIYRFGHLKDCSDQWAAFWFCMRVRTLPERDKEGLIRDYYAKRDEKRLRELKGGSEAVWEMRTTMVQEAFGRAHDEEEEEEGQFVGRS